jgi:hypothetical protein
MKILISSDDSYDRFLAYTSLYSTAIVHIFGNRSLETGDYDDFYYDVSYVLSKPRSLNILRQTKQIDMV